MRICLGPEAGAGAEVSFLIGLSDNGFSSNFDLCASLLADVDAGLLLATGMQLGFTFDLGLMLEFTLGFGLGGGAGCSFCFSFGI